MTDNLNENWRPIPGVPFYHVSDLGRVRSDERTVVRRGKPLKIPGGFIKTPTAGGYPCFNARRDGKTIHLFVHRVVMLAFVGPAPAGQEVRHKNGNRADGRLENLEYGTRADNIADAKRHGTFPVGEQRPGAILTREQAVEIVQSKERATVIGPKYGIAPGTVHQIRGGLTWTDATVGKIRESYRERGEAHPRAKLTEADVRAILASGESTRGLARKFGVDPQLVRNIRKGVIWKHIARPEIASGHPSAAGPNPVIGRAAEGGSVAEGDA